ncbi:hypothetical protein, partial [uncultured Prevotellamassilia sp.]|uniref:hypothetical protein n=1 Tax=uncultured Prevotellamassilia sp. TaxID=1926676 RepID=UPI00258F7094
MLLYNKVQISSLLLSQLVCHSGKGNYLVKWQTYELNPQTLPLNASTKHKHKTLPLMGATRPEAAEKCPDAGQGKLL